MSNQTFKNDPADRSDEAISEQELRLRSIWQGYVESNHDLRFWRPLY